MIADREIRRLQNIKEISIPSGDTKSAASHAPSALSMNEGEMVFAQAPNGQLALYKKHKGLVWKTNLSKDGKNIVDDLIVKGNVEIQNIPMFDVYRDSSAQANLAVGGSTGTLIQFNEENIDNLGSYDTSTYLYTVPVTGYYLIYYNVGLTQFDITSTPMTYASIFVKNDASSNNYFANTRIDDKEFTADTAVVSKSASQVVRLESGSTIGVYYYQNGGAAQVDVEDSSNSVSGGLETVFGGYLISK